MSGDTCSGTQAGDCFGIVLDFVNKLHGGSITPQEAKRFLRREDPFWEPSRSVREQKSLFAVAAVTRINAIASKPTAECFPLGGVYAYRARNFGSELPAEQSVADACDITTLTTTRNWTFIEAVAALLSVGPGTDVNLLGKALTETSYVMSLTQVEEMVGATIRGEKTRLNLDYGSFFFVRGKLARCPILVGCIDGSLSRVNTRLYSLEESNHWLAESCLIVPNLSQKLLKAAGS